MKTEKEIKKLLEDIKCCKSIKLNEIDYYSEQYSNDQLNEENYVRKYDDCMKTIKSLQIEEILLETILEN